MDNETLTNKPAAATHHADCGEVGETGEHGELGSNSAGRQLADTLVDALNEIGAPSAADLDNDAAEKAAAAATASPVVVVDDVESAHQVIKEGLLKAGYTEAEAQAMAESAVAAKKK
jgi:hypothetical protein